MGADHVKDGKLEKGDIAQEEKTQINHVNALKMDANLHDKSEHGNMHLCTIRLLFGVCLRFYHLPLWGIKHCTKKNSIATSAMKPTL